MSKKYIKRMVDALLVIALIPAAVLFADTTVDRNGQCGGMFNSNCGVGLVCMCNYICEFRWGGVCCYSGEKCEIWYALGYCGASCVSN